MMPMPSRTRETSSPADQPESGNAEVTRRGQRRRFSAAFKLRIVREADGCTESGEIGALLRREGLYSSHLGKWREALARHGEEGMLTQRSVGRPKSEGPSRKEFEKLVREKARLQKRLAQAELIIDVQKKLCTILGLPTAEETLDDESGS